MSNLTQTKVITPEVIQTFIEGHDPMERIVNITYSYQDDFVKIFYRNENDQKCVTKESYYPFVWATLSACQKLCNGDRNELKKLMATYNIGVKKLSNTNIHGEVIDEFNNGYLFMFFAKKPMKYGDFLNFFKLAKNPIYGKKNKDGKEVLRSNSESKQYLIVPPVEQFMISTGKRFFKGYDDYDQVYRMIFDLETEGLDPNRHRINQIGIRTNRGFEKIISVEGNTKEEKDVNELIAIDLFLRTIYQYKPDIITAHNGENFDWSFIIARCEKLGTSMQEMSSKYFDGDFIKKDDRESILKLGGEMEKFRRTIVPNTTITDSLHAVRRTQALDSNFLKADLKYSTEYLGKKKPNRVYVPGDKISSTWNDITNSYALNNNNGDWYCITEDKPIKDEYDIVTGKYIVERYLLDDIWECDKVEYQLNTPDFLLCKLLPVTFQRCVSMGTAVQWKAIFMAWSYENDIAIPMFGESKPFTGGLSRLLKVGFVDNVAKFDYNSLYPSIILTWGISDRNDLMDSMLSFLEYVLTQREKYKKLRKGFAKKADKISEELKEIDSSSIEYKELHNKLLEYEAESIFNEKKEMPIKRLGNGFFGSLSAPNVFPWGSLRCGEQTTCTGRQCLRLMISHFSEISQRYNLNDEDYNYSPIVGDSFAGDTPLYIKYKDSGLIDIKPIELLINESSIEIDELGREYDYSKKEYYVLCRSGWVEPSYIYRHKTDKPIYRVTDGDTIVDVTEDHSLFNDRQKKIKPTDIDENTKLEYYTNSISGIEINSGVLNKIDFKEIGKAVAKQYKNYEYIPFTVYNSTVDNMKDFYYSFMNNFVDDIEYNKSVIAGLQFIKKKIKK